MSIAAQRGVGGRGLVTALLVLIAVNVALLSWLTYRATQAEVATEAVPVLPKIEVKVDGDRRGDSPSPEDLADNEKRVIDIFQKAAPSVVYIQTHEVRTSPFSRDVLKIPTGAGSGFVWDDQGHIVTNFHVIKDASAATVTLADQSTYDASAVGVAPSKDIAVLKIQAPADKLHALARGSSADLRVGQATVAIGNPFGLDHTLSTGVVSGLGREIQSLAEIPIFGVIQTDAAINPGNSGGPLLDSRGRLIGMNTAIYSPSGASAGIGFAVPVDTIERVVPQLIEKGKITRPSLGIKHDPQLTMRAGINGVLVLGVLPDSGAAEAGLRGTTRDPDTGDTIFGDIIISIDGKPVANSKDLYKYLDDKEPGDRVIVGVKRGEEETTVKVTLKAFAD